MGALEAVWAREREQSALAAQIQMNIRKGFVRQTPDGLLALPCRIGEPPEMRDASASSAGTTMMSSNCIAAATELRVRITIQVVEKKSSLETLPQEEFRAVLFL